MTHIQHPYESWGRGLTTFMPSAPAPIDTSQSLDLPDLKAYCFLKDFAVFSVLTNSLTVETPLYNALA